MGLRSRLLRITSWVCLIGMGHVAGIWRGCWLALPIKEKTGRGSSPCCCCIWKIDGACIDARRRARLETIDAQRHFTQALGEGN